jgi:uncharacterized protein
MEAARLIQELNLQPHPEGGYYKETYRGEPRIKLDNGKERNSSTAIYYMLTNEDKSHFHKVLSDEIWLFHQGETIVIYEIDEKGELITHLLGINFENGETLQIVIPKGNWFAAQIESKSGYSLVSCIVAPGFEFEDFILADKQELLRQYPEYQGIINEMSI